MPDRIGAVIAEMLSPLQPVVEIAERCPDCHAPLHGGMERHWITIQQGRTSRLDSRLRRHRCTGLDTPAALVGFRRSKRLGR